MTPEPDNPIACAAEPICGAPDRRQVRTPPATQGRQLPLLPHTQKKSYVFAVYQEEEEVNNPEEKKGYS